MTRRLTLILAVLPFLAVAAAGAAYVLLRDPTPSVSAAWPELAAVPARELEAARAALPEETRPPPRLDGSDDRIERRLEGCSPRAVLAVLVERAGGPRATRAFASCLEDERCLPVGAWLADRASVALNPVLLRIAADEALAFPVRDTALVALCRPGNLDAVPALVRLAQDMEADGGVRGRILFRLPRIGGPPPRELETLLHLPFHDHDGYAAALLAIGGRPLAPSLVLEALTHVQAGERDAVVLLADAVAAIAHDDADLVATARRVPDAFRIDTRGDRIEESNDAFAALASGFARWLDTHPEARDTPFELALNAYRAEAGYARVRRTLSAEDPSTLPDAAVDLGAAVLRERDEDGRWRDRYVAALDRMVLLFRRELTGVEAPEERLAVLHRRLMPRRASRRAEIEVGPSSFLDLVLRDRTGNCTGLTTLYVALGERLGLPLVAVHVPHHVFLRWEDGERSFDVELTDGGRIRTSAEMEGVTPRVLSRKGLVSVVLSNLAATYLESPMIREEARVELATDAAKRSLAWDPENAAAHLVRAQCRSLQGNVQAALDAAETAAALAPDDVNPLLASASALLRARRFEAALDAFGRALVREPTSVSAVHGRLLCLESLGRYEEVVEEAEAFPGTASHGSLRGARLRARVRLDRTGWERELEELALAPPGSWQLRLTVAELLLERGARADARRVLAALTDLDREVREAEGLDDDANALVEGGGDAVVVMQAKDLRALHHRAQALRREARGDVR